MEELEKRILDLFVKGYNCSQCMLLLSMEMRDIEDDLVLRCMAGLGGGMACGKDCGGIAGGACMISSYAVQMGDNEHATGRMYKEPVVELVKWFEGEFGSVQCCEIVSEEREARLAFCPGLVAKTFTKCLEILESRGIDPYEA